MQLKYRVEILNNETGKVIECWSFRTRRDISIEYNIPTYIIDKIIKKTNIPEYTTKRDPHMIYKEIMQSMRIKYNKPKLHS